MSIWHLERAKELKQIGDGLGREGMSLRVIQLVDEFNKDGSYKGAMELVGRFKAIAQMANSDLYWSEKVSMGFQNEHLDIQTDKVQQLINSQREIS